MRNVYEECPVYETESFILRQVQLEDAQNLPACYSDKENVAKLNADYNTALNFNELVTLAIEQFAEDFSVGSVKIKTANISERVEWLERLGFVPSETFRPEYGYHEYNIPNVEV